MRTVLFRTLTFASRAFSRLSRIALSLAQPWKPVDFQETDVIRSTRYDMMRAPDEPYYADQYWSLMRPYLELLPEDAKILDLGCSQGRFTIRLGKLFERGQVVACDLSASAIAEAKGYADRDATDNIEFQVLPIADCLESLDDESCDAILLIEITLFYPQWQEAVVDAIRTLKPGGVLFVSFRSQYFDALSLVRSRRWEDVQHVLQQRKGTIFGSSTVFTWQTSGEVRTLLIESVGLDLLELRGIGVCSGIANDPHDHICRPSQLTEVERQKLMKIELELGKTMPDSGRYMLAVARKPSGSNLR